MAGLGSMIAQHLESLKANPAMLAPPAVAAPAPGAPAEAAPPAVAAGQAAPAGPPSTIVSVAVDGLICNYELTDADVRETFQRWGSLQNVHIYKGARDIGVVTFADAIDAADAQKQLNGYRCNFTGKSGTMDIACGNGSLVVVLGGPDQIAGGPPANVAPRPGPTGWSCKVLVQAERMHPQFLIVPKILGANNANVEHVQAQSGCNMRLRGRNSGHLEKNTNAELQDVMAIWLSAEGPQSGTPALEMCQDLLRSVYEEHGQFVAGLGHQAAMLPDPPTLMTPNEDGSPAPGAPGAPVGMAPAPAPAAIMGAPTLPGAPFGAPAAPPMGMSMMAPGVMPAPGQPPMPMPMPGAPMAPGLPGAPMTAPVGGFGPAGKGGMTAPGAGPY